MSKVLALLQGLFVSSRSNKKFNITVVLLLLFVSAGLFQNCSEVMKTTDTNTESTQESGQQVKDPEQPIDTTFLTKPFRVVPQSLPDFKSIPSSFILDAVVVGDHVIVGTQMGLGVSHDKGNTFKIYGQENGFDSNVFSRVTYTDGKLYVANDYDGRFLYVSTNFGDTFELWQAHAQNNINLNLPAGRVLHNYCISNNYFYMANMASRDLYVSIDSGATFIRKSLSSDAKIDKIFCDDEVLSLVFYEPPTNSQTESDSVVGVSYDHGQSFIFKTRKDFSTPSRVFETRHVRQIAVVDSRHYILTEYALFESKDNSATYTKDPLGRILRGIASVGNQLALFSASKGITLIGDVSQAGTDLAGSVDPSQLVFFKGGTGQNSVLFLKDSSKLFIIASDGASYTSLNTASDKFPDQPLQGVDYIGDTLFVLGGNGLFSSENDGNTFKKLNLASVPNAYRNFGYNATKSPMIIENGVIYISDGKSIFISRDKGQTFDQKKMNGSSIQAMLVKDNYIYVLASGYLEYSSDNGATFEKRQLPDSNINGSFGTMLSVNGNLFLYDHGNVYFTRDNFATYSVSTAGDLLQVASLYEFEGRVYIKALGGGKTCFTSPADTLSLTECSPGQQVVHFARKGIYPKVMLGQSFTPKGLAVSFNKGVDFLILGAKNGIFDSNIVDLVYSEKRNRVFVLGQEGLFRSVK